MDDLATHAMILGVIILGLWIISPVVFYFTIKEKIPVALQIAKYDGWVSPHLLHKRTRLPLNLCQKILNKAVKKDLLFCGEDGFYYIVTEEIRAKRQTLSGAGK